MSAGFRGRPNLTDLSRDSVITTLKFHVDKILEIDGPSYYNVIWWVYQGKIEYIFLHQ